LSLGRLLLPPDKLLNWVIASSLEKPMFIMLLILYGPP
jgi:hypothetical protein